MVGETIMLIAYGLPVGPIDDPYLKTAERALQQLSLAAVPGKYPVDSLPSLKYLPEWMPGAGFQKMAREGRVLAREMIGEPYEVAKKSIVCTNSLSAETGGSHIF